MKRKFVSHSLEETQKIAGELAMEIVQIKREGDDGAVVIGLIGDLGSGKTSFAQGFIKVLGVKERVVSPTFVILKKYGLRFKIYNLKFKNLIHIDAYRIKDAAEMETLSWNEIIKDPRNIILIEWPENIKEVMPKKHIEMALEHKGDDHRSISFAKIK